MSNVTKIEELREKRAGLYESMKELNSAALAEERDLSAEEAEKYDKIEADFDAITRQIDRTEKLEGIAPKMTRAAATDEPEPTVERSDPRASQEYRDAFNLYLRQGDKALIDPEVRAALQVGTDSEGGYTVADEWERKLVESLREFGVMRQLATVITTSDSGQLHIPAVDAAGTAALTAEEAAFTESEDTFKEILLDAYKVGTLIKISDELLHDSIFDLSSFIQRRAAQAIAIKENAYFVAGTGTAQPNGLATAASVGKTFVANNAITADELIDLFHSVLPPYRRSASWMMNDSTIKVVRKLKDTTNQYLWQPGLQAGEPDTLLGRPVFADPDVAAIATVAVSVLFGDISAYWIRDVSPMSVKVLNELYAANGQVGYRVDRRSDGDLVDTAAVKSGKHPV